MKEQSHCNRISVLWFIHDNKVPSLPLFCEPASIFHHPLVYKTLKMGLIFQTSPVKGD